MKSAMKELIEEFEFELNTGRLNNDESYILKWSIYFATQKLEKEKEQIVKAVDDTRSNIVPRYFLEENLSGEEYYNQTYNK